MLRALLLALLLDRAAAVTRLLLFGDSLTAGVVISCCHPYAYELARLTSCEVFYAGYHGATAQALRDELDRTHSVVMDSVAEAAGEGAPFTAVMVLVGTNDIRHLNDGRYSPEELARRIRGLHERLTNGSSMLSFALGVPPLMQDESNEVQLANRRGLNALLRRFAEGSGGRHFYVDVEAALPRLDQSEAVREHRYADVHFTPHGYNELANVVGDALMAAGVPMCYSGGWDERYERRNLVTQLHNACPKFCVSGEREAFASPPPSA